MIEALSTPFLVIFAITNCDVGNKQPNSKGY